MVYVSNTILGPIMGMILAGAIAFAGLDEVKRVLEIPIEIEAAIPYAIGAIFATMTTTCCSISMDGKTWWIGKTLPLLGKTILDAKILMNLLLIAPFYLIAELMLIWGLRPMGWDLAWMLLAPAILCLFSCVYGIAINLCFPVFNWENEVTVVKQSMSTFLGGMGGMLLGVACTIVVLFVPDRYKNPVQLILCMTLLIVTCILYCKNNQKDLKKIS